MDHFVCLISHIDNIGRYCLSHGPCTMMCMGVRLPADGHPEYAPAVPCTARPQVGGWMLSETPPLISSPSRS